MKSGKTMIWSDQQLCGIHRVQQYKGPQCRAHDTRLSIFPRWGSRRMAKLVVIYCTVASSTRRQNEWFSRFASQSDGKEEVPRGIGEFCPMIPTVTTCRHADWAYQWLHMNSVYNLDVTWDEQSKEPVNIPPTVTRPFIVRTRAHTENELC